MLKRSRNLKNFKNDVGQLNHFLITIEVGLKNISSSTTIPSDFKTSWNPRDYIKSVERSEIWARKSALTYICSALEGYFESVFNTPTLIHNVELNNDYTRKKGNSDISPPISWKFKKVNEKYDITTYKKELVQLMILWRNGLVHNLASFCTHPDFTNIESNLRANKADFYSYHCHLDIEALIDRFKQKKIPTFKETTSMIKVSIDYLYELDQKLIQNLDHEKYIQDCICDYMRNITDSKRKEYFMYNDNRRISFLSSVLQQNYAFESNSSNEILIDQITELARKDQTYFN